MATRRMGQFTLTISGSLPVSFPLNGDMSVTFKNADTLEDRPSHVHVSAPVNNGNLTLTQIFNAARNMVIDELENNRDGGGHTTEEGDIG